MVPDQILDYTWERHHILYDRLYSVIDYVDFIAKRCDKGLQLNTEFG